MNTERLLFLAKKLRENADNPQGSKFDLQHWFAGTTALNCGTTACAMSFACLLPEFQTQGLYLSKLSQSPRYKDSIGYMYGGFSAAREFFEITSNEALQLFSDSYYATQNWKGAVGEQRVADKIEALCRGESISEMR